MKIRLIILTLLSTGLLSLALPNEILVYGSPVIGVICIVPFLIAVTLSPSLRFSLFLGLIFGVVSTLLCYYWLMFFKEFSVWTITGTALGYAIYFSIFAPFLKTFSRVNRILRPFLIAIAWSLFEYFKATGYLGFPWGLLAYPAWQILPFIQIADITGIWGVSLLLILLNTLITETVLQVFHLEPRYALVHRGTFLWHRRVRGTLLSRPHPCTVTRYPLLHQWITVITLIILALTYGFYRLSHSIPAPKRFTALLVQQNIDSWVAGNEIESLLIGENLTLEGLAEASEPVDIVIWSETSLSRPFTEFRPFYAEKPESMPFLSFLEKIDTYLLVGAPYAVDWENYRMMNSVIMLHPEGRIEQYYGKQHPVPLAEHIPFWEVPAIRNFFQNVVGLYSSGWVLGKEYTIFTLPTHDGTTVTFGAPICFEDAFPSLCRRFILQGADLLINLTNDSWSRMVSAETQHFVAALFRSVETKRVLIRSTNAGVTAVVGPFGRVLESLPLFTEDTLYTEVPVYKEDSFTPYTLYGDYLPFIYIVILVWLLFTTRADHNTEGTHAAQRKRSREKTKA
jgi:apolipoprotein N-acyltransferase